MFSYNFYKEIIDLFKHHLKQEYETISKLRKNLFPRLKPMIDNDKNNNQKKED